MYVVNSRGHLAKVEDYDPTTMVLRTLTPDMKPTQEQIVELEKAEKYPAVYDDDCPKLTPALIKAFEKAADERDEQLGVVEEQDMHNLYSMT